MGQYYDHKDLLNLYRNAIANQRGDEAINILLVMAEVCPIRKDECLDSKFCPDCSFYERNGIITPEELEK